MNTNTTPETTPTIRLSRIPRGWHTLVSTADRWLSPDPDAHSGRIAAITNAGTVEGRLMLEGGNGTAFHRGVIDATTALSAEVCAICGGKAAPVVNWRGEPEATRCVVDAGQVKVRHAVNRKWPPGAAAKLNGTLKWRLGETLALETRTDWLHHLLQGNHDYLAEEWLGIPEGWAGLARAALLALCEEPEYEGPDTGDRNAIRWIQFREKVGRLEVRGMHGTPYWSGVQALIYEFSARVCIRCGTPGAMRNAGFMRPECSACWQHTGRGENDDRKEQQRQRELWTAANAIGA